MCMKYSQRLKQARTYLGIITYITKFFLRLLLKTMKEVVPQNLIRKQ